MSYSPEHLARLTAQSSSFLSGLGGRPELTKAEFAAVLCKVHPEAQPLALYRYAGDERSMPKICYQAWIQAVDVFNQHGWKVTKAKHGPLIRNMGVMALEETLARKPCKCCGGSRYELNGQWCSCCEGAGLARDPFSDKKRAETVGMAYTTWVSTWRSRYIIVRKHIGQWVSEKDSQIWEGLRGQ